jgi:DNA-binding MarR family transcriptional regulator
MIAHAMTTRSGTKAAATSNVLRLWQAVAAAHARLAETLDGDGATCAVLGSDAVAILLPLAESPERQLRMNELAERSHLTPSGLTRRIDRLEVDGLVTRALCPGDRRGAFARLTDKGAVELDRALPHHTSVLEDHVAPRLDDEATDHLVELLEQLAAAPQR